MFDFVLTNEIQYVENLKCTVSMENLEKTTLPCLLGFGGGIEGRSELRSVALAMGDGEIVLTFAGKVKEEKSNDFNVVVASNGIHKSRVESGFCNFYKDKVTCVVTMRDRYINVLAEPR